MDDHTRRQLEAVTRHIVAQHTASHEATCRGIHDATYWQILRACDVPIWAAIPALIARILSETVTT